MKKFYIRFTILSCILFALSSCSKKAASDMMAPPSSPNIVNASIAPNQSYQLVINNAGEVNIDKQALHYKVSQAGVDAKTGHMVYEYIPAQDFSGTDEVIISNKILLQASSGSGCHNSNHDNNSGGNTYDVSYTTIRLIISN
ncbi:MAG: hypothetical protein M3Z92_09065 [Bacteroidota bacterium]|nr:hypothetical protein [Bacteroidota bacterium]MDQ6888834.1 hypothetical protein [Bacteroidota bacterium]